MKCKYCGKNISAQSAYCPYCRRPQQVVSDAPRRDVSQDTDLFVNMNRRKKMAKKEKPLTNRQQLFPYLSFLVAAVIFCVVIFGVSKATGHLWMEKQNLADLGVTPEAMEQLREEQESKQAAAASDDSGEAEDSAQSDADADSTKADQ